MSESFDAYRAWLGIPPEEQPPNYYRLLGARTFEEDPDAIAAAADGRVGSLHAYQAGSLAGVARRLLAEVADAKACLLNPTRKAAYDKGLRESLQAEARQSEEAERARADRFLSVLQERDLLPAKLIDGLRTQVTQSKKPVPAEAVAKRLIEAGQLTPALAERLLAAGSEEVSAPVEPETKKADDRPAHSEGHVPCPTDGTASPAEEEDDDLQLAPLDDGPGRRFKPAVPKAPARETTPKTPAQQPSPKPPPQVIGAGQPPPPPPANAPVSLLDEDRTPGQGDSAGTAGREPLDGMMGGAALDAAAGGPLLVTPGGKGWRRLFWPRRPTGRKANVWDSPLLLVGGGILLLLVFMLIGLVFVLGRQTGNEALRLANADYDNGSYSQAIHKYNQYLEKFGSHHGVSLARVNRGLAQLRQVTLKGTSDWPAAFQVAKGVLEKISLEKEEFPRAQGDVSGVLLTIARGLAAQARENPDPALVEKTRETLALMRKYVPPSPLPVREMSEIEASLALTEREIARDYRLAEAIAEMKQQVGQGNTQQAYAIRKALLKDYPLLADDEQLGPTLIEISRAQQQAVETVQKEQPAKKDQPATPLLATVAVARRVGAGSAPDAAGRVVFALAGGAAYGLDAESGRVLWRRFVGFDANGRRPSFPPTPTRPEPGSDVLLLDAVGNELLRVEADSGRVRWRHAIGEPLDAHPVIAGGQILVATRSGKLVKIDAAEGSSSGYIQLPQALRVAPAVDLRRLLIFQVADHSNLFVLALADGQCKQVVHLGHELGTITAPPVVVGRFLLVVVNDRAQDSALRVLSIEEGEQGPSLKPVQRIRLKGHVDAPLAVDVRRGRVLAATDLGSANLFEVSGTDATRPVRVAAETAAADVTGLICFPVMQTDHVWIAGYELTKYYIELSRRRLVPKRIGSQSGAAQQPPVTIGQTIFHVRRGPAVPPAAGDAVPPAAGDAVPPAAVDAVPGVLVSAVDMDEGRPLWETHLAVPLATEPIVDPAGKEITAVTSMGGVYRLDAAALKGQSVLDEPEVAPEANRIGQPVGRVIPFGGGLLVITTPENPDEVAVFDPTQQEKQLRRLKLPGTLACPPIAFAGGLLAPCQVGQVFLIDLRSGAKRAEPFQPRLQSGVQLSWRLPAAAGERAAVLADGHTGLYRLEIEDQPKPNLLARNHRELSKPIVSPVAVVSDVAYAVDAAGVLNVFKLPELTPAKHQELLLSGRCVWGPRRVGEHVMLWTDDEKLLCLNGNGELLWQIKLPYGPPAGTPLSTGGHYILAAVGGVVWRVDARSGEELGKIETGRPLGTGPVLLGKQLLLGGRDGSLYQIERP